MGESPETRISSAEFSAFHVDTQRRWYAVQTRARHEKRISSDLTQRGICAFVPTLRQAHRWSDRAKIVDVPLFSCYVFVNLEISSSARQQILRTPGVFRFVSVNGAPAEIPDTEIESIQTVLARNLPISNCGFVHIGQKVRIKGGALDGVEGILEGHKNNRRLIISVNLIQQSLELTVEGYEIEVVPTGRASAAGK